MTSGFQLTSGFFRRLRWLLHYPSRSEYQPAVSSSRRAYFRRCPGPFPRSSLTLSGNISPFCFAGTTPRLYRCADRNSLTPERRTDQKFVGEEVGDRKFLVYLPQFEKEVLGKFNFVFFNPSQGVFCRPFGVHQSERMQQTIQ